MNPARLSATLSYVKIDKDVFDKYEDQFTRANLYVAPEAIIYADKGDTATHGGITYKVTNAARNGSDTVSVVGFDDSVAAVSIPGAVWVKECTYKVNKITASAFKNHTSIVSVSIGSNVTTIDSYAFSGCTSLTKITGGSGLKTISSRAFNGDTSLSSFTISSKKLKKIGSYAFSGDKLLKTISIKKTTKLTRKGVKKSLKGSSVKTVKVKKSKVRTYKSYFKKSNSGRKVKVKK